MEWSKGRQLSALSNSQLSMQFRYNQSGIRTSKTVNGVKTEYTYVGSTLVSQKTGNEVINFAYIAGGAPYGFTYNGIPYFYILSLQGDIIGIYDSMGTVVVEYTYDSWGKLISITGSLASTIGVKNPLRYRGYYYDTETSLYYLQSRYYDPETCRFINADAYLIAGDDYIQGTNMYAYCYNNPVMYVDPNGCSAEFLSFLSSLTSGFYNALLHKKIGSSDVMFGTAWNAFLVASDAIGFTIYNGVLENIVASTYDSGVVRVVLEISGSLTENGYSDTYMVELFYGTHSQWVYESVRYQDDSYIQAAILAIGDIFISVLAYPLTPLINVLEFALIFIPDEYQLLINDMMIKSLNSDNYFAAILQITSESSGKKIYSYAGGWG